MAIGERRIGEYCKFVWVYFADGTERWAAIVLYTLFPRLGTTLTEACVHLCQAWKRSAVSKRLTE
jgi:hypothetical protein